MILFESEPARDDRGSFIRAHSTASDAALGLSALSVTALAHNPRAGTLRGLHFQHAPHAEAKLVSCASGRLFDVALDLRPGSPTFEQWFTVELVAGSGRSLYIPEGLAHGYLTLEPDTTVLYHVTDTYAPAAASGVRWDDPRFAIPWPAAPRLISERDRSWPDFNP